MNKKGFTLIELLATITIISIVTTMISINIFKAHEFERMNNEKKKTKIITSAACIFIEFERNYNLKQECLITGCDINSQELIKAKLLNENDVNNNIIIHISKENLEKQCKIKES